MSLPLTLLNTWLRWTEKPFLANATSATALRRSFDLKSRLFFHAPLGTQRTRATLAGADALEVRKTDAGADHTILYFHGGAHVFGSPRTHAAMLSALVKRTGGVAVLPRYPLAPEHPFPAAIDHCVACYRALLNGGQDPARLTVGGDSAGGNLAFAVLATLLAEGDPLPAGVFGLSPLMDLTFSGPSHAANADSDVVLPAHRIKDTAAGYLAGHAADDPRASPLFADLTGAPPVWLTVGDTEILTDDSTRLAERLRAQSVPVDLTVARDRPHVWTLFHNLRPEAHETLDQLAGWITAQTGVNAPTR